jgi:hypothetical protein
VIIESSTVPKIKLLGPYGVKSIYNYIFAIGHDGTMYVCSMHQSHVADTTNSSIALLLSALYK